MQWSQTFIATSTHKNREPVTIILQALSLVEMAEPVQVRFTLLYARGTNTICECKMDVKSTWIPTWHQMAHVSWSFGLISKTTTS
jgi:hypothetical protein